MSAEADDVVCGDMVELRCADGTWVGPTKALSDPHLNIGQPFHKRTAPWSVISVQPEGWEHPINWPTDAVRLSPMSGGLLP